MSEPTKEERSVRLLRAKAAEWGVFVESPNHIWTIAKIDSLAASVALVADLLAAVYEAWPDEEASDE